MLSTPVYCVIHVTTVWMILIWAPGFTKGKGFCRSNAGPSRKTCSTTDVMFCHPGQRPQIVEAYFVNATDHNVCGFNCKATPAADGDFQCVADLRRTGSLCVQRLGYTDLDVVYMTCAALSRNCRFSHLNDTNLLSLRSTFTVGYLCIQDNSAIDPCHPFEKQRSHASLWLPHTTTSCHSVCEITPVNTERSVYFKYQFISSFTKSSQVFRDNNITYEITFTPSTRKRPEWKQFHSSYYDDYQLWQDVDKLRIWFIISRGDVVRHLSISFNDTEVNIACTANPTATSDSANNNMTVTSPLTLTRSKTDPSVPRTSPPNTNNEEGGFSLNTTHTLIIGMAVGAVLASTVAVGVCVVLRKRGRSFVRPQPRRQLERAPSHPKPRVGNPETGSRLYDEIREDFKDNLDAEVNSLPVVPRPPGPASQSNISQRPRETGTQAFDQSAVRVLYPPTGNSGYVDMSGTTQADEGLDAHSYVNTEVGEASADADGYLIARPAFRAHQAKDTTAEYIELLP